MKNHSNAYLSPSRLSCYDYCPGEFRKRYILKKDQPPTPERLFGTAVHKGLEAQFTGQDDELAFVREWGAAKRELQQANQAFGSGLTERGLELLEMVRKLDLHGEPEHRIGVVHPEISLPFLGYVDLWAEGHIVDFKTTGYSWTQTKTDAQMFQPAIYSQAHADEFGSIPKFTFIVLPRIAGPAQILDGTRTADQIISAFECAKKIHELIEARVFDCTCGHHEAPIAMSKGVFDV